MEDQRTELEFDELEKLLGEIPHATYTNSLSAESETRRALLSNSLTEKAQISRGLDDGKLLLNKTQPSPIKGVHSKEANLPNDQSLTSVFAEMNLNNGLMMESANPTVENCKSSPINTVSLDSQYAYGLRRPVSTMDSCMRIVPSLQSPNNAYHGFNEHDVEKIGQEISALLKLDGKELKTLQVGYQPIENFSSSVPLANGVQGFQFLSNVPVPNMEFSIMPDMPQYFVDAAVPYIHPQQLNQSHFRWKNIQEEEYRMLHQRCNQQVEAQLPIRANGSFAFQPVCQDQIAPPHLKMPSSHQLGLSNQEPFWNNQVMSRGLKQRNLAFPLSNHSAVQVMDKVGKLSFPEKILTRPQGQNMIKSANFGSFGGNEFLSHANQNGKHLSNGHFHQNLSSPNGGCFQLDILNSWGGSLNTTYTSNTNMRSQPQKYNSLDEVIGKVYTLAKDQHGCRFLQRQFSEGTAKDIEKIFLEIIDHIVELMTDPFGNYLVQKLLEVCNENQRMEILHAITRIAGDLIVISCDMHGTRAVQKVIETLKTPEQFSMVVASLKPGIVTLMKDINGNHVAQRCLQHMPEYSEFLIEAATSSCVELATDCHGCCVLQKCLAQSKSEQRRHLVCEITSNALILSQDPFGNYVVQFVLDLNLPWATSDILDQLEGNYGDLSMQKCGSHVVERCMQYAGEERRVHIIWELINNPHLDQIMQDPYGNYVIQAALRQSKGTLHAALVNAIRPHVPLLRTSPYGKKVLSGNGLKK